VALRARAQLAASELRDLSERLDEMDKRSRHGPWTRQTLELIREKPATLAAELAAELGREKRPFKADVRRLKELGLTESLERGYRLSPRGRAFIEQDLRA
jgi:predicted transcriptional regulator